MRGENIKVWANHWLEENHHRMKTESATGESTGQEDVRLKSSSTPIEGFSRSYKFFATEPNDVKVSDIPSLLEEYKLLVQTTEALIMERNSINQQIYQKKIKLKRKTLESSLNEAMKNNDT